MIFIHLKTLIVLFFMVGIFIFFCAAYAYRVNAKRAEDDPEKRDFSPYAVLLAPVILPILLIVNLLYLILSGLAIGVFLLLFPFALLLFRKPFLIQWILKQALKIGNQLLEVDTALLRATGLYRPSPI